MKRFIHIVSLLLFTLFAQASIIPTNTATHTAVKSGDWFDPTTWDAGTVPGEGAIVNIPVAFSIDYQGCSADHIFAINLEGELTISQPNTGQTTCLTFDTFWASMSSYLKIHAQNATDGEIDINIAPFDIETYKSGPNNWNANALAHFSDGAPVYEVTYNFPSDRRYETYAEAMAAGSEVTEATRTLYDDGIGVTGRYNWDPDQHSIGMVTMGQLEIIGQEKLVKAKLAADALNGESSIVLEEVPTGWKVGDLVVVGRVGTTGRNAKQEDERIIQSISGTTVTFTSNLSYKHQGNSTYNLHTYAGNLDRNITFKSSDISNIHRRGHFMHMHNNTNMQVKNAAFIDMGRTDKTRLTDDFKFDTWVESKVAQTMYSPLGQEICQMRRNADQDITNIRGRYSIHMHKTGAKLGDNMVQVTGNVVWGNPGWGITQHDSYANVSNNFVYEIIGSGIVSESGSELGFWDNNLVIEVQNANGAVDPYDAALWFDDLIFQGQGLGMKGRAVICRDNVIIGAQNGVGIVNLNPSISNHDRVDPLALREFRKGYSADYDIDLYPLNHNGYSAEGDGVVPMEIELIMENTTVIEVDRGFRSLERDQGLSHESRSIFDGFIIWGAREGIDIVYQADYSYKDVTIVGKGKGGVTTGIQLWKHAFNHSFENVKMADLQNAISCSDFTNSTDINAGRVRNNSATPWLFVDLQLDNVENMYEFTNGGAAQYVDHSDNAIHLSSSELESRATTFTIVDSSSLSVDVASENFRFEVDGYITDDFGTYDYGVKQCATFSGTQVSRVDYEARIYEFASKAKFEEYLTNNGVYRDAAGQLYFIVTEFVPNRRTFKYTGIPIRVNIMNAPSSGIYATAIAEPGIEDEYRLVSHLSQTQVNQSSTQTGLDYLGSAIDASAQKANDGINNGRENFDRFQAGYQSYVGSFSQTQVESNPWFDISLADTADIKHIDIWNTVDMNGTSIETPSTGFKNFYVLLSNDPFSNTDLATSRAHADHEYYFADVSANRKATLEGIHKSAKYVRIQAEGSTALKLAEVYIIGKQSSDDNPCELFTLGEDIELCDDLEYDIVAHLPAGNSGFTWFNDDLELDETSNTLTVNAAGKYSISYTGSICNGTDTVEVTSLLPTVTTDTVCTIGDQVNLSATGLDLFWYENASGGSSIHTGNSYDPIINATTTYYVASETKENNSLGKSAPTSGTYGNGAGTTYLNYGRVSELEILKDLTLVSLDISCNSALSAVTINITKVGDPGDSHSLNFASMNTGMNTLSLNVPLTTGTYTVDFNGSDGGIETEYENGVTDNEITDLISFTNSSGTAWYGMLYNIKVETAGRVCSRVPVTALLDETLPECITSVNNLGVSLLDLYPNPTNSIVHLSQEVEFEIFNTSGTKIKKGTGSIINLSDVSPGVYFIVAQAKTFKVIKVK